MIESKETIGLFVCRNLAPEVAKILKSGAYPDVRLVPFPNSCTGWTMKDDRILEIIEQAPQRFRKVLFFVSSCRKTGSDVIPRHKNVEIVRLEQCLELMINRDLIYHWAGRGSYMVTDGWLMQSRRHLDEWGFDGSTAPDFFRESLRNIVYLNTGISEKARIKATALSEHMGLPVEEIPIGLYYCRKFIDAEISRLRFEIQQEVLNKRLSAFTQVNADYLFLFKQLQTLLALVDENAIVRDVFQLFNLLFAPADISYQSYEDEQLTLPVWFRGGARVLDENTAVEFEMELTDRIGRMGLFRLYGLGFPEFINRYRTTLPVIKRVCETAMANAHKYDLILRQREELQRTAAQLDESVRTKDRFFSIIGHDLRSPFNAVVGYSSLLQEMHVQGNYSEMGACIQQIQQASNRALNLLTNLLDWARAQTGRIEFRPVRLPVADSVRSVVALVSDVTQQKGVALSYSVEENLFLQADQAMFETILRNLITNAVKFSHPGTAVLVSAGSKGSDCLVEVEDHGVGIPSEKLDLLFRLDENYSTPGTNKEKGSGLGLVLCKEFVDRHNGRIWVESVLGEGSAFFVQIPRGE